jgi:hypothetical protein
MLNKNFGRYQNQRYLKKAPNANMLEPKPSAGTPIACFTPSLKGCDENKS